MTNLFAYRYPLFISIICISVMFLPESYRQTLYLHLELAKHGEYWRFITGHFVHASWLHCISNIAGLFLLFSLFQPAKNKDNWLLATIMILAVVSLGLTFTSESLKWYIGFSGILTGLFAYICLRTFPDNAVLSASFLLIVTTYVTNQVVFNGELIQAKVFQDISTSSYAHLFGLVGGLAYGVCCDIRHHSYILSSKT